MLGLHCCAQDFSPCGVQASHCSGFSGCRAQAPELAGFSSGIFPDQGWNLDPPLDHQGSPLFRFLAGFKFSALDKLNGFQMDTNNQQYILYLPYWKILKRDLGFSPGLVLQRSNAWVPADLEGTTCCKYVNVTSTIFGQHTKTVHLKCSGGSSRGFSGHLRGKEFTCQCRRCAGRSLEKEMATHSNVLAWEIQWPEQTDRLLPMFLWRVGYDLVTEHTHTEDLPVNDFCPSFPPHTLCTPISYKSSYH